MPTVHWTSDEEYPAYIVSEEPSSGLSEAEITEEGLEVVRAYLAAQQAYQEAKAALVKVIIEHCPECGHKQFRHQEFSSGWDYWGCLDQVHGRHTCRCQHGKPEGR